MFFTIYIQVNSLDIGTPTKAYYVWKKYWGGTWGGNALSPQKSQSVKQRGLVRHGYLSQNCLSGGSEAVRLLLLLLGNWQNLKVSSSIIFFLFICSIAEDTTHFGHRTWRSGPRNDLEASFLIVRQNFQVVRQKMFIKSPAQL